MMMSLKNISLAQVVDTMAEGVFVVDASHHIVLWNKAMELLTGYSQAEALGKDCSMLECGGLHGPEAKRHRCPLFDLWQQSKSIGSGLLQNGHWAYFRKEKSCSSIFPS